MAGPDGCRKPPGFLFACGCMALGFRSARRSGFPLMKDFEIGRSRKDGQFRMLPPLQRLRAISLKKHVGFMVLNLEMRKSFPTRQSQPRNTGGWTEPIPGECSLLDDSTVSREGTSSLTPLHGYCKKFPMHVSGSLGPTEVVEPMGGPGPSRSMCAIGSPVPSSPSVSNGSA